MGRSHPYRYLVGGSMTRAERDAAVELTADLIAGLFIEHKATCVRPANCPTTKRVEDALKALYSLRKAR